MFLGFSGRGFGPTAVADIDVTQLDSVRATHRLIDVRDADELVGPLALLPDAEHVPLDQLTLVARDWDRSQPLVLICQSGARSARGVAMLKSLGFDEVYNLRGGMVAHYTQRARQVA